MPIGFELTAEQLELREVARRFAYEELQPEARRLDRESNPQATFPRQLLRRADQLGLRTLALPREYGGRAAGQLTQAVVLEELCTGDAGFGMTLLHAWREGYAIACLTTDEQRAEFLPAFLGDPECFTAFGMSEAHAGSDHATQHDDELEAGARTVATRDGDSWVLNGRKKWITNGNVAKIAFVLARTNPDVAWTQGVSMFLLSTSAPGFSVGHVEDKLGLRLNQNAEMVFQSCRIPGGSIVGDVNRGLEFLQTFARGSVFKEGIKCLGVARAAYEEAIAWTNQRVQGGKRLAEHQSVRAVLVTMATEIEAARALAWKAAWAVENSREDAFALEGMAKTYAAEVAVRAAVSGVELAGGYGIVRDGHAEKLLRDAATMMHAFGGNHAVRDRIASFLPSLSPHLSSYADQR
jgi:alkylation response protein AidB-like acyl-CoA dehydrogenase